MIKQFALIKMRFVLVWVLDCHISVAALYNKAEPFINSRSGIFTTCGLTDYVYALLCFYIVKFFLAELHV